MFCLPDVSLMLRMMIGSRDFFFLLRSFYSSASSIGGAGSTPRERSRAETAKITMNATIAPGTMAERPKGSFRA